MSYIGDRDKYYNEKIQEYTRDFPECVKLYISANMLSLKPSSLYNYVLSLWYFIEYGCKGFQSFKNKKIKELTVKNFADVSIEEIQEFQLDYKTRHQDKTTLRMMSVISAFYAYYVGINRMTYNPVKAVNKPKLPKNKEINRLKGSEKYKLLNEVMYGNKLSERQLKYHNIVGSRDYAIVRLILYTGIRVSELVGLDVDDVNFEDHSIIVTRKGGATDAVFFDDETEVCIREYLTERLEMKNIDKTEKALFLSLQKRRISVRAVENLVKKYAATALPLHKGISPHRLRATFGTDLYESSKDIYVTSKRLGHENISTTTIYAEVTKEKEKASRNMLK